VFKRWSASFPQEQRRAFFGDERPEIFDLTGNHFAGYAIAHGAHGARLVEHEQAGIAITASQRATEARITPHGKA
jgi:hypothetical protein